MNVGSLRVDVSGKCSGARAVRVNAQREVNKAKRHNGQRAVGRKLRDVIAEWQLNNPGWGLNEMIAVVHNDLMNYLKLRGCRLDQVVVAPRFAAITGTHVFERELDMAMANHGLTIHDLVEYKLVRVRMALRVNGFKMVADLNA